MCQLRSSHYRYPFLRSTFASIGTSDITTIQPFVGFVPPSSNCSAPDKGLMVEVGFGSPSALRRCQLNVGITPESGHVVDIPGRQVGVRPSPNRCTTGGRGVSAGTQSEQRANNPPSPSG